jgi:hypothetical protein
MQQQREIYEFFGKSFNERFEANMAIIYENLGKEKLHLSPESKIVMETCIKMIFNSMKSQNDAIAGAISETLAHFYPNQSESQK